MLMMAFRVCFVSPRKWLLTFLCCMCGLSASTVHSRWNFVFLCNPWCFDCKVTRTGEYCSDMTDFSITRSAVWDLGDQFSIFQIVHIITVKVRIVISGSRAIIFIPWLFHLYSLVVIKTNQYQETAISYHSQTTIFIHPSTISLPPSRQQVLLSCPPIHSLSLGERSSRPSRPGTLQYCLII
jgi:hypothetical protein